ncbi:6-phospho-3-hexuloisomerase [Lacticaseibacillus paracasei]|uniref:6-phospho-3-hexuloisomerase n=1 Tax=Lacticaseibacillus paracasei TaxID=1597 RepID=UPI0022DF7F88|nr:6-phospho-3-hexuloisomerase [Lacticaseibacillus paracasei]
MTDRSLNTILEELTQNAKFVKADQLQSAINSIMNAKRIFLAGAGRSGFAARGFANRLMHLEFHSNFVGDTVTPSIQKGDLLIIGSGSGETASLVSDAKKAKQVGAHIGTLTIFPENTIGSLSDWHIVIPGVTSKVDGENTEHGQSIQPHGSSFEQLSWLVYDALVVYLMQETKQGDNEMFARHANLE